VARRAAVADRLIAARAWNRMAPDWPAIEQARWQRVARVPFLVEGRRVGSVAAAHLSALRRWPQWVAPDDTGVRLLAPPEARDDAFAQMHAGLRDEGLIVAWRDETFALFTPQGDGVLATFERAAARFWGTLTLGAHCNGWVAGHDGQPSHLWIARRADHKATDPGKLDNLVGGGVPFGQTPHETLVREGFEEAGLDAGRMRHATPGRTIVLDRDVPEGRQFERLFAYDLELPAGVRPANQDGEVAAIEAVPVAEAAALAAGEAMTVDAALVTLDFLLRRRLLPMAELDRLRHRAAALWA
jgi:8-oxo-dGTP pyrophosphatase MutT (NUDIX family)